MAQRQVESVYRIVDVVGESETSWEEAARHAVETAATSIRDLRVAEVVKMDMKVENGKVTAFRTSGCSVVQVRNVLTSGQRYRTGRSCSLVLGSRRSGRRDVNSLR